MPHAVETMFSVREVPWHRLGTILEDAPDSERALIAAGLNWGVEQHPMPHPLIAGETVEGWAMNVRATDKKVLGICGTFYKVLQNREAFNWMDGILAEGAVYETAGSLHEGKHVWMLARLPEQYKLAGDAIDTFLLVNNSHDGTSSLKAAVVPVRVVCQNTLNLALRKAHRSWSIRHSGDLGAKLDEAKRALKLTHQYMNDLTSVSDLMASMRMAESDWNALCQNLLPVNPDAKNDSTRDRQQERQDMLFKRMFTPDLEPHRMTAWGAINAVADYADHAARARVTDTSAENRFKQVINGHPLVDQAFDLLKGNYTELARV